MAKHCLTTPSKVKRKMAYLKGMEGHFETEPERALYFLMPDFPITKNF